MNRGKHLTENQLTDYFGDALERGMKREIGRHLLQCDFCLKRLPQPTPEQFMAALMTENESDDDSREEKTALPGRLGFIAELLTPPKILVLSAGALAIALFFTAFTWLNAGKSSFAEKEVAENFEVKETLSLPNQIGGDNINLPQAFPNAENGNRSSSSKNTESKLPIFDRIKSGNRASTRITSGQDLPVATETQPKPSSKIALRKREMPDEEKANVSSTRGGTSPKCGDQLPLDLAVGMNNKAVILKWKKIPNAAKYHLYVSDDEEILIDEFETEQETSYALKKPLAPQKTYQWKVVITLENGQTVTGDSQNFTIKDLQSNQKKSDRREKPVIRCSESKLNR